VNDAGHTKAVLGIRQHPSLLNMAVSCGEDRLIKVWSLNDGICQRSILCRSKPLDVAFTGDGQCIVSAHYDGSLHIFDASTGSEMRVVDAVHRKELGTCVAVVSTAHASRMVSVGRDSTLCITDINKGEVCILCSLLRIGTPVHSCSHRLFRKNACSDF
jgi:WD40 repeat protein